MKNLVNEISKGKNVNENLGKYSGSLLSLYNRFSNVRLCMNYYSYYEVIEESESKNHESIKKLLEELNVIINNNIVNKSTTEQYKLDLNSVSKIRNSIIESMKLLTSYTDIFNIYEYVLNRVEHRYDERHLPLNYSDEKFTREIMQYILSKQDNTAINYKITETLRQIPVRMARGKFFELVENGLNLYEGNSKSALDDFIYMIRTSAMLDLPDGFETDYPDLYSVYNEFSKTDFNSLTAGEYENLSAKLAYVSVFLQNIVDRYVMLCELVNDVYSIMISMPYAITDMDESKICKSVITAVNGNFMKEHLDPLGEDVTDMLIQLEGKQEHLGQAYMSLEGALDDIMNTNKSLIASLGLENEFDSVLKISGLVSGSLFVELDSLNEEDTEVTSEYLNECKNKLFEDLSKLFEVNSKMVNRAVMSSTLSMLPVFFENITVLQDYIFNSLEGCSDEPEKLAVNEVMKQIINEDEE